jgi:hypothetical protein
MPGEMCEESVQLHAFKIYLIAIIEYIQSLTPPLISYDTSMSSNALQLRLLHQQLTL